MRPQQSPLRQFRQELPLEIIQKIEDAHGDIDRMYDMEKREIGDFIRFN